MAEVAHEVEAQPPGHSLGDRTVAREVAVDLEGKRVKPDHHHRAAELPRRLGEHVVHNGRHVIGDDDFQEQSVGHVVEAVPEGVRDRRAGIENLRHQGERPLDRPGHQLREERDVEGKIEKPPGRRGLSAIHVDRVAQGLEGVERDADRQDDVQRGLGDAETQHLQQVHGLADKEAKVFEDREQPEVECNRDRQEAPLLEPAQAVLRDGEGDEIVHHRRGQDEPEKPPVPIAVKHIAGHQQEPVLTTVRQAPVNKHHNRKEDPESVAIEEHQGLAGTRT